MSDRYVVLGLAHPRSEWFRSVGQWATGGSLPVDFVKCVSVTEVIARLGTGRSFSALLVDAGVPGVDRDLLRTATEHRCVTLVVRGRTETDWIALGAAATLTDEVGRDELLGLLREFATPLGPDHTTITDDPPVTEIGAETQPGLVVAVVGAGGSGASSTAAALAHGLGTDVRHSGRVLLADLALDADQAMMHNAHDIVPGVQELVEAFRSGTPSDEEIWASTFGDRARAYRVLLGLRRHQDWPAIRPASFVALFDRLASMSTALVCDTDADVEGEDACGSLDVEDRNVMARTATARADIVVVTGHATTTGIHRIVRIASRLVAHGVNGARILPVATRASRSPRARSEITHAVARLTGQFTNDTDAVSPVVFVPVIRRHDVAIRDASPFPVAPHVDIASAVISVNERLPARHGSPTEPEPVVAGSLGAWHDEGR